MSILKLFAVEETVEKIEGIIEGDLHQVFTAAKVEAAKANAKVDTLKAELALAIHQAAELSQKASDAAIAAAAKAAKDVADLTDEAKKHADLAVTQSSQIVVTPEATPVSLAKPS